MISVASSPAEQHQTDWLGAWVGDLRIAVPAAVVHAVFSIHDEPSSDTSIAPLDVTVHAGVPVFLIPLDQWLTQQFESQHSLSLPALKSTVNPHPWVIAFRSPTPKSSAWATCVGCRVQGIRGPFKASAIEGQLKWDDQDWQTWTPKGLAHE